MRKLRVGDIVSVRFHGNRAMGNEPFVENNLTVSEKTDNAIAFSDGTILYFWNRRWRYGTSAEVASLI